MNGGRRRLVALALVGLLVAMAGCGFLPGEKDSPGTATPKPTATPLPEPVVGDSDVNVTAVLETHTRTLAETDNYTVAWTINRTSEGKITEGGFRINRSGVRRVDAVAGTARTELTIENRGPLGRLQDITRDRYTTRTETRQRESYVGGNLSETPTVTYNRSTPPYENATLPPAERDPRQAMPFLNVTAPALAWNESGTETIDGESLTIYRAGGVVESGALRERFGADLGVATAVNATMGVGSAGRVRYYRVAFTAAPGGEPFRFESEAHLRALGSTTVERPSWYDRAG